MKKMRQKKLTAIASGSETSSRRTVSETCEPQAARQKTHFKSAIFLKSVLMATLVSVGH